VLIVIANLVLLSTNGVSDTAAINAAKVTILKPIKKGGLNAKICKENRTIF
jgi:hypothetical protein